MSYRTYIFLKLISEKDMNINHRIYWVNVALKFYNKGERGKYDVLHEMKDSRSFSHRNIIRVHDAFVVRFEQAGTYSYVQVGVLELANGGNLRDFINTKPPDYKIIEILTGILEGLKYLHSEKNIIHRDLSPENILMVREGDKLIPKISDFGISKKLDYESLTRDQKKSTQLLGKVDYMAPEQFSPDKFGIGGNINTNVDLWAFGIILYEMFLNQTPFGHKTADNPFAGIHSIVNDPVYGMEGIPSPYRKVVERCLVKNADRRARDAEELIQLLKSHRKEFKAGTTKTMPVMEFGKTTRYLKWTGIAIVVTVLFIGGYFAFNHLFKPSPSKAGVKMKNLVSKRKFDDAILLFENLPEGIKSDPDLKGLYHVSIVSTARDKLNTLVANGDFKGAGSFYGQLNDSVRNNPEISAIYNKMIISSAVDSLLEKGKSHFEEKNYEEARIYFNTVLGKYDPDNQYADSMIIKINYLIASSEKPVKLPASTGKVLKNSSGRNFRVDNPPDPKQIKLLSINLTTSETRITLEIQPSGNPVTIYSPRDDKAFYIEYNNGSQQLPLLDVQGVIANEEKIYSMPAKVHLIFGKLPENLKIFNLMEGKNQLSDHAQNYFNFKGIRLIQD